MASDANPVMYKVTLKRRVVVSNALVFNAERELCLPIQPFVGLRLYHAEWQPPSCDGSEDPIDEIAFDLKTGHVYCYLSVADFRPESSGGEWTEADVREAYQDWTLTPRKTRGSTAGIKRTERKPKK